MAARQSRPAPPRPLVYDWQAPGVGVAKLPVAPPRHNNLPGPRPIDIEYLKFNPIGLFELRRNLGVFPERPSLWNDFHRRWESSDIGFFVGGASSDGQHHAIAGSGFFPAFEALRESVPANDVGYAARRKFVDRVQQHLFDVATILDRTVGSTTMVMHVQGTTKPGTPALPEFLTAAVYIPPSFLRRFPESHLPIAQMVQTYIEHVGVPTVEAWVADAKARRWNLTQTGPLRHPNEVRYDVLIPPPRDQGTAVYVFEGRPAGTILSDPAPAPASVLASPSGSQTSTRYGSEVPEEFSADALALISALEHISVLEDTIKALRVENNDSNDQIQELTDFVATLQAQLTRAQARAPTSPRPEPLSPRPHFSAPTQFSTPSKSRTAFDMRSPGPSFDTRSPYPSSSPIKASAGRSLIQTTEFLDSCPHAHTAAILGMIKLMIRNVPTTKWYEEIAQMNLGQLGLEVEDGAKLLEYLTQDFSA
ncbi:hypothetical protein C8R43DRAFT_1120824 [Mycena crocata]|nr:hypothetical protein C8R43DRAFT_1120824 [Mycena crocata]